MANTRALRVPGEAGELASLLAQLTEEKDRLERLLSQVDDVLRRASASDNAKPSAAAGIRGGAPQRSALDEVRSVMASTADLREENGNLSAARIARVFGVNLAQLAGWLGRSKQAVSKTPDAESLQEPLAFFERVARLRMVIGGDAAFRKWLRTSHEPLGSKSPLELLAKGDWQVMADHVEDALTGASS